MRASVRVENSSLRGALGVGDGVAPESGRGRMTMRSASRCTSHSLGAGIAGADGGAGGGEEPAAGLERFAAAGRSRRSGVGGGGAAGMGWFHGGAADGVGRGSGSLRGSFTAGGTSG